jgi:predicted dehydrogenase
MAFNTQPPSAPRTRLAVLGCGALARDVVLPVLSRISDVDVTVVADPDQGARDATVRFAPYARALADWRDAVARTDVDGVIVALPTAMHAEAAIAVMAAGRHLYLEKPIAATVDEAQRIIASIRQQSVRQESVRLKPDTTVRVGFNYRFNPLIVELKRRLRAGAIGGVKEIRTTFSTRAVPGGWRRPDAAGGGVLLDLGSHHIDLIRFVTGDEIASVSAELARGALSSEHVRVAMQLSGGPRVHSMFATGMTDADRIEVTGERGALRVDRYRAWMVREHHAVAESRQSSLVRAVREAPAAARYALAKQRSPWHEPSFELSLRDFVAACAGRQASGASLADGLRALEIVEAAHRSAASGQTVTPGSRLEQEPAHVG